MTVVWIIAAVMLTTAAAVTMFRLLAGPSTLDRLVALDTLVERWVIKRQKLPA